MNRCSSIASLVIGMALFLTLEEVSASWRHSPEDSDSIGNSALQSSVNEESEPRISVAPVAPLREILSNQDMFTEKVLAAIGEALRRCIGRMPA